MATNSLSPINRRRVIAGAGAGALALGLALPAAAAAAAPDVPPTELPPTDLGSVGVTDAGGEVPQQLLGSPVTSGSGSSPVSGFTYRTLSMYDFFPFWPDSKRQWNGYGTHCIGVAGPLRGSVEIPAGALVRDVEYYVSNNSGNNVVPFAAIYVPGSGTITVIGAQPTISSSGSGIQVHRAEITSANWGPYPIGTRLIVNVDTPVNGLVQVNGARVGFSGGAGSVGLLPGPVRVYDSRETGGALAAGSGRTITLPPSVVPPGATGVLVNVTAVGIGWGFLKIYPAGAAEPAVSSINFNPGEAIANGIVVGVNASRQIRVYAGAAAHFILDVTGIVS